MIRKITEIFRELFVNQNQLIVQGQLDAYNKRDLETFCGYYSQNIIVKNISSQNALMSGLSDLRQKYSTLFSKNPSLHCELKNRMCVDNYVVDEEFVTGLEGFPHGLHIAAIYLVRGKFIEEVVFTR